MTRKERKAWEKRFKPFYETREKEQILNQHLKLIMNEDKGLSENEIYCRLMYSLCNGPTEEDSIN
mgnify:FL=1|jgi:hypothetical protein|tara:strand:+ start:2236 stop:2430 length:195 start_codon:yes stop_codon:yes gene_type:complete